MKRHMFHGWWPWLLLVLTGLAAVGLRYGLVQTPALAALCEAASPPWWCALRDAVIQGFLHDGYGVAALLLAALSLWRHSCVLAWLAAALGAVALQLYNVEPGAVALLVGCLRLVHLQGRPKAVKQV